MSVTVEKASERRASQILVIDDSASVCFAIERILAARGLDVSSERSGAAAMERLQHEAPDLVLLDLVLPDVEGFDVCSFMQAEPRLAHVSVVVISGIVDNEIRSKALRLGAVGVLKKPFATQDLVDLVERVLSAKDHLSANDQHSAKPVSSTNKVADASLALAGSSTAPAAFVAESAAQTRDSFSPTMVPTEDLDLPMPSAALEFIPAAVTAPDAKLAEALELELERFNVVANLRFAVMVHANGEMRGFGERKPKLDSTLELVALLLRGNGMSVRLGNGELSIMTLESEGGTVVIQPRDDSWLWAVGVSDRASLGKVRFLMR